MEKLRSKNKHLITITGPTAIGKTNLAIRLAQHFNCSIVSCDSRQFYREMTIGTAVPTADELKAAPHYFIQNKSIFNDYNVGDYEREALPLLNELFKKNNTQILVGGSGLYLDAVLNGLDSFPIVKEETRQTIEIMYQKHGLTILQEELERLDPEYYTFLYTTNSQTLRNPQRMKRFVGVCIEAQAPYSSFLNKEKNKRTFIPILVGLEAPRDQMYHRINCRVDQMIRNGLLHEAASLHKHQHLNALQTVGYRELFDYFNGTLTLDQAIEEIKKNTRRFAKRQLTWFKRNKKTEWFSNHEPIENIIKYINDFTQ